MIKIENSRAYKQMEEDEPEKIRMNGDNNYNEINIVYHIDLNYTDLKKLNCL